MSTLTLAPETVKATLEIKNATYSVRPIDPGFAGVAAVEVTKLVSHEAYVVVLQADGRATCECPDFVCRHADHGTHCKHIKGVLAAGLLVAPIAGGSPVLDVPPAVHAPAPKPAFAPITKLDLKRAAFFGLRLPDAPMAVEPAPAPVREFVPEAVAPTAVEPATKVEFVPPSSVVVAEASPEIPADDEGPAWVWDAWTDEFTWELGPEATTEAPALASDDESACPVCEDDHRAWQARQRRATRFTPSVEDDAYASGLYLQLHHGLAVEAPSEWPLMRSSAFRLGQAQGLLARHRREDQEMAEWVAQRERERSEPRDADGYPAGYYS
jgi:hypothetical protein